MRGRRRRPELRAAAAGERGAAARAARAGGWSCAHRRPELRGAAVKTRAEERSGGNIWGRG
jgi:hypothetical protein